MVATMGRLEVSIVIHHGQGFRWLLRTGQPETSKATGREPGLAMT